MTQQEASRLYEHLSNARIGITAVLASREVIRGPNAEMLTKSAEILGILLDELWETARPKASDSLGRTISDDAVERSVRGNYGLD